MASPIQKFLNANKVEKGSEFTHTSLNGGIYYIQAMEMDKFNELYATAIENGETLSLTEKHREISPILVDLDFRQNTADRLYTEQQVKEFVKLLSNEIEKYVEVESTQLKFYVMEKPEPRDNKGKGFKDGIHIVCPDIVTAPEVQFIIRENILKNGMNQVFGNTFTNKYDDIYDADVIAKNNWFMYGSKKPDEAYPWTLTKIYDNELNEIDCEHTDDELISVLSIRNKFDALNVKADKMEEVQEYKNKTTKKPAESKPTATAAMPPPSLDIVGKLVSLLNADRADSRTSWIEVGLCLHNIDYQLLGLWIEFSKQSAKFCDGECEKIWASFTKREGGLSIGTLHKWAKEDSPEKYKEIVNEDISTKIYQSRNGSHHDIAKVVHAMFKDTFVCCFLNDKPFWYEFKGHRWIECPDGVSLRQHMSSAVYKKFTLEAARFHAKSAMTENENEQASFTETAKALTKISMSLKMAPFKANVMKECRELFVVGKKDFYDKLDENKYLLGFDNGVYDLAHGVFRDGRPEDYLTMSVGYDYVPHVDAYYTDMVHKLLQSIFPDEETIQYMLNTFAYALSGDKFMEFLQFWIGTGANGKGGMSKLLEKTLGEYCYSPDVSVFTTKKTSSSSANPELAKMKGKRLAIATEPNEDDKFQVGALKAWTGGDKIQARALYKDNIEFDSQFLIIIQMNHKPALSDFDMGIARRLKNVEFPHKFVANPQLPHERQLNASLKNDIANNVCLAQQFMRILIEVYNNNICGNRVFSTPTRVQAFTQEYLDANNKIGAFLMDCCEITNKDTDLIRTQDMFDMFKCSDHYNGKDIKNFVEHMAHCGFKSARQNKRGLPFHTKQVFIGIKEKKEAAGYGFVDNDDL